MPNAVATLAIPLAIFDHADGVHRSYTYIRHEGLDGTGRFSRERRFSNLLKYSVVVFRRYPVAFHEADSALSGETEAFTNDGRVDVLLNQILASLEQFSGKNHSRRRAVIAMLFLSFGHFNDHFRRRMLNVHLLENGRAVVRDDNIAHGINEHLVHTFRSQCGPDSIRYGLGRCDVV